MNKIQFFLTGFGFSIFFFGCAHQAVPVKPTESVAEKPKPIGQPSNENTLFYSVDTPSVFPGGFEEMDRFIARTIRYPEVARKNGEQGKVMVMFIQNQDGTRSDIKIARGISESLDKEALRVVNLMPNWSPAMQNGKLVKFQQIVPIPFTL